MSRNSALSRGEVVYAEWARRIKRSALQEMLSIASGPDILSLALGLPAPELFPTAALLDAASRVLSTDRNSLQYSPPGRSLKTRIVELMATRGVECSENQVFLTCGAQQGMNLLTRLLLDPHGQLVTEEMSYPGFLQVVEPYQPEILAVPTDIRTGMDIDFLEDVLDSGARPAFIYSVTDGHNPLGVSLSPEKRKRLVDIARYHNAPIIEDDAYGFLNYGPSLHPPLRSLDDEMVYYVGSFSKILAPSLRVGWIVAPEAMVSRLSIVKEASDIDTSTFAQRVVLAYLETGALPGHLELLRREYGGRRDAMIAALEKYFPEDARWSTPDSGVFVWVELGVSVDMPSLLRAAVEDEKVAFIPGHAFYAGKGRFEKACMRLNYSNRGVDAIEEGVKRLGRVIGNLAVSSGCEEFACQLAGSG